MDKYLTKTPRCKSTQSDTTNTSDQSSKNIRKRGNESSQHDTSKEIELTQTKKKKQKKNKVGWDLKCLERFSSWLCHDEEQNLIWCKLCKEYTSSGKEKLHSKGLQKFHQKVGHGDFVSGKNPDSIRADYLTQHEKTTSHIECVKKAAARDNPKNNLDNTICSISPAQQQTLEKYFETAFYIAIEELPPSKYCSVVDHLLTKKIKIMLVNI